MNFYEILKTKKLGRGSPDYWTQLFAEHVGGKGEWKVAGVLPLTFTAKGGNAVDWVIYGNDENGTENLVEGVIENANISDTGIIVSTTSFNMYVAKIVEGREYTITTSASSGFVYGLFRAFPTIGSQSYDNNRIIGQRTFTAPIDGYIAFRAVLIDTSVMFTEGSTAPDRYIPYQQGVGERTENLVESIEQGTWSVTGFVKEIQNTRCRVGNIIDVVGSQQYTMYLKCPLHNGRLNIQFKNDAGRSRGETGWQNVGESGSYTATIPSDATKITIILSIDAGSDNCSPANFTNVMLVKGSTAPETYIPHGYQIPLTVESGETENLWNENYESISIYATYKPIYVGNGSFTLSTNAPLSNGAALIFLMPGQQSSGGTTARDGVYDGSPRTVTSVDGYVTLIYRIYGYEDPRDYQTMLNAGTTALPYIPHRYTSDIPIYIGDTPLTEGETVSKTSTGVDIELFEGENTVSTTLYNKPTMEIKYK